MTATTADLDTLVESIADGDDIDWTALEAGADEDVSRLLAHLKAVSAIGDVHRTPPADAAVDAISPAASAPAGWANGGLGDLGRWGHLQLVRKVGEGQYGEVYHARDTWLDHPVALKLLRPVLSDRVSPTRLLDEARVLVKVRHPNVVAVHGADRQQGRVGFWMEFVQGQRLDDLIAFQGLLGADDAAQIGQQLCAALTAVHEAGLVHRDVKAQNVMRDPKGRVVLMDFGAGHLMADAGAGGGAGTPLYLAPELFTGGTASARTDVYALGVLLYHLVTASYPVTARSIEELKAAHAAGRRTALQEARPGLPRAFTAVVEKMLAADPGDRHATADEALAGLRAFTAPASLARRTIKWAAVLAAATIVLTALGLVNTATFNIVLGRGSEFDSDRSIGTWFRWGLSSTVPPVFYTSIWALLLTLLGGLMRLIRKLSPPIDRAVARCRARCLDAISERGLDDPALVLQCAAGLGVVALIALAWAFWDYGAGMMTSLVFVSDAPAERLAAFRPDNEYRVDSYGRLLDLLLLLYGLAAVRAVVWARRINASISRTTRVSAAMVPVLALVLWQLPYRAMYQSHFERVDYDASRCYRLGDSAAQVLLHCPDDAPPRNRIVSSGDPRLHRRGVVESMFLPARLSQPTQ